MPKLVKYPLITALLTTVAAFGVVQSVYLDHGHISIEYAATFDINSAKTWGGGISISKVSGSIFNSIFSLNHVLNGGGAVHLYTGVT